MKQRTKKAVYPIQFTAAFYFFFTSLIIGFTALIILSSFFNPDFLGPVKSGTPQQTAAKPFYLTGDAAGQFTIHFYFDDAGIRSKDAAILKQVVKMLRADKKLQVNIEGHADKHFNEYYNKKISLLRAQNAREYLLKHKIAKKRIKISGFGSESPDPKNRYMEWLNRRTEITVFKK